MTLYYLKIQFSNSKGDATKYWLQTEGIKSDVIKNHWARKKKLQI